MTHSQVLSKILRKAAAVSAPVTPVPAPASPASPSAMPAATPSVMDQAKTMGSTALNAGEGFAKQELAAGKSEVNQAKPLLEQAGAAVKPYFNGLGTSPGQWAMNHPIGTAVAGLSAAFLLHHILKKKTQPEDGQPKMASAKLAASPFSSILAGAVKSTRGLGSDVMAGGKKLMAGPSALGTAGATAAVGGATALAGGNVRARNVANHLQQPAAPVAAPAPSPVSSIAGNAQSALAAGEQGIKDGASYVGDTIKNHPYAASGAAVGAAALLAHLLNKPSKKDQQGQLAPAA